MNHGAVFLKLCIFSSLNYPFKYKPGESEDHKYFSLISLTTKSALQMFL